MRHRELHSDAAPRHRIVMLQYLITLRTTITELQNFSCSMSVLYSGHDTKFGESLGFATRLPQLAGSEVCNSLIFLDPAPKGRHYTASAEPRAACSIEEFRGVLCAGRFMPGRCAFMCCFTSSWGGQSWQFL